MRGSQSVAAIASPRTTTTTTTTTEIPSGQTHITSTSTSSPSRQRSTIPAEPFQEAERNPISHASTRPVSNGLA